ncbi:MAG: DUF58 domain-containing protein [Varibaculum sp.]|nr:DUF58 domain-containing protein [Varibaculum sp.]
MKPSKLELLRSRLSLPVLQRSARVFSGVHHSRLNGYGQDFDDLAEYKIGDDVGDIDWKSSAAHARPIIKRFERSVNVAITLLVDTGRSMSALAPSREPKEDIALEAAEVLAYIGLMRGDLVGMVSGDAERLRSLPARGGNEHVELLMQRIRTDITPESPESDLSRVLQTAFNQTRGQSIMVLLTDSFAIHPGLEPVLRKIRSIHRLLVVMVADADPTQLVEEGQVTDVSAGELMNMVLDDEQLHHIHENTQRQLVLSIFKMLRRLRVPAVTVTSTEDAVEAIIDVLGRPYVWGR